MLCHRLHPLNGIGDKVDSVADPDKADEPHTVEDLHVSSGGDNYSEVAEVDKSYSELEVDSVADPDKADEPDTVEDLHVSSGGDNSSEVAEVDKSYSELEVDSVADPDYDPASTHESPPLRRIQDTDELIVSKSVKEVRPCVAEHIDNDHRREIALHYSVFSQDDSFWQYIVHDDIFGGCCQRSGLNRGTLL